VESIVVNPPWNVPPSIAMKEEWPKERAHPGYLASHGFRVISDGAGGVRLQQIPSASALGKLKFDFPSPFGVYLHDTPTRSTFAHDTRAASHGCVRLEHPFELATMLLQEDPEWRSDNLQAAIDSGDTSRVHLQHPMPLAILYWTVFVAGGQVNFRTDYYNWDQRLLKLIDQGRGLSTP
jgi:murein L,D-transpeptidase YcbB/YkuD